MKKVIDVVRILPSDVILVRLDEPETMASAETTELQRGLVESQLRPFFPENKIVVVENGIDIRIMRHDLEPLDGETPLNAGIRRYMAEQMGMEHVYEDQDENFILGHLATFVQRLYDALVAVKGGDALDGAIQEKVDDAIAYAEGGPRERDEKTKKEGA